MRHDVAVYTLSGYIPMKPEDVVARNRRYSLSAKKGAETKKRRREAIFGKNPKRDPITKLDRAVGDDRLAIFEKIGGKWVKI
jgi:hypothetical protein